MFNEIATAMTGIDLRVIAVFLLAMFLTGVGFGMCLERVREEWRK